VGRNRESRTNRHRAGGALELGVIIPVVGGIVATLVGVVLGGVLTRRAQERQWLRDRQLEACLGIMRESNRAQFALRAAWREGTRPDWVPWNEALTIVSFVHGPEIVTSAQQIDETFWETNHKIGSGQIASEEAWAQVRDVIEKARLDFVNLARRHLTEQREPVSRLAARMPLAGGDQYGGTAGSGDLRAVDT
jgi:hypothetical protein